FLLSGEAASRSGAPSVAVPSVCGLPVVGTACACLLWEMRLRQAFFWHKLWDAGETTSTKNSLVSQPLYHGGWKLKQSTTTSQPISQPIPFSTPPSSTRRCGTFLALSYS